VQHQQLTEELREQVALYALGSLPPEQAVAFADHLAEGCQTCAREMKMLTSVVDTLGYAAAPIPPRPALRTRLLAHIQGLHAERTGTDQDALPGTQMQPHEWTIVRATEGTWEVAGVEGVVTKRLSPAQAHQYAVRLVRMRGEVSYAVQRHADRQELYVLAGALTVADQVLQAGDYCAGPVDTGPTITSSPPGCTCLVLASAWEAGHQAAAVGGVPPGLVYRRSAERTWQPSGIQGVEISPLLTDPVRQTSTALVRMSPGARLPRHRHVTDEQFYMLEGDGHVQGQALQAGDYYRAVSGTVHDSTYTDGGCLFLLLASHMTILA
jgi:anti-sigma factor ChrR (cupin superfamily)